MVVALQRDIVEDDHRQGGGNEQQARRHQLAGAGADDTAQQPGDGRAQQRKENDRSVHRQPFITLMSSTAMAAVAETDHQDGEADGGLGRRDGENE